MRTAALRHPSQIRIRTGDADDFAALLDLEERVFASDCMSRRSLRRFLASRTAAVVIAERNGAVAGYALVLFRPNSAIARLYSLAVSPLCAGCGVGPALLAGAEQAALSRDCHRLRLEVHERNHRAIELYRKCGYRQFGRYVRYYLDEGDAYRFEKTLARRGIAR